MIKKGFRKATRQAVKASIMIEGVQGTGKSGLALMLAYILADKDWSSVYALDTESQSLDLFDGLQSHTGDKFVEFNKVDLTSEDGYAPSNYEAIRQAAIEAGAKVFVQDSISHMWNRKGGMLDLVTKAGKVVKGGSFSAWGTDENIEEKELIFDLVRSPYVHTIVTVRSKEKFEMERDDNNRAVVKSLGEQQVQQDGLKYEPDLVLRMVSPGHSDGTPPVATVLKSRYAILVKDETYAFTTELLEQLKQYLSEGVDPTILIEMQRKEILDALKPMLQQSTAQKSVWKSIQTANGFEGKTSDMDFKLLRKCFNEFISE